jgi:hypothetical protein
VQAEKHEPSGSVELPGRRLVRAAFEVLLFREVLIDCDEEIEVISGYRGQKQTI